MSTDSTIDTGIRKGTGSPEGVVSGGPGTLYRDQTAGAGQLWIKQSGTGNTGWTLSSTSGMLVVRVATTANLASLSGLLTIDGVATAVGDRVLVKNQNVQSENGIYTVSVGAWTRALDFNTEQNVKPASVIGVSEGTVQRDSLWILTTNSPVVVGTTSLTFQAAQLPFINESMSKVVPRCGTTPTENGTNLVAAYAVAKNLSPNGTAKSRQNRVTVLIQPGTYELTTGALVLDTEFVDLIGESSNRLDAVLKAPYSTVTQSVNDVRIENVTIAATDNTGAITFSSSDKAAYVPTGTGNYPLTEIRNVHFQGAINYIAPNYFGSWGARVGIIYSGWYEDLSSLDGGVCFFGCTGSGYFSRMRSDFSGVGTFTEQVSRCTVSGRVWNCQTSISYQSTISGEVSDCPLTPGNTTITGCIRNCRAVSDFSSVNLMSGGVLSDIYVPGIMVSNVFQNGCYVENLSAGGEAGGIYDGTYRNFCIRQNMAQVLPSETGHRLQTEMLGIFHDCHFVGDMHFVVWGSPSGRGRIYNSYIVNSSGGNEPAVVMKTAGTRFFNCTIVGAGTGESFFAGTHNYAYVKTGDPGNLLGTLSVSGKADQLTYYWRTVAVGAQVQIDFAFDAAFANIFATLTMSPPPIAGFYSIPEVGNSGHFATCAAVQPTIVGGLSGTWTVGATPAVNTIGAHNRYNNAPHATYNNLIAAPNDVQDANIL